MVTTFWLLGKEWAYEVHNQVCMGNLESQKCIRICWCPPRPPPQPKIPGGSQVTHMWRRLELMVVKVDKPPFYLGWPFGIVRLTWPTPGTILACGLDLFRYRNDKRTITWNLVHTQFRVTSNKYTHYRTIMNGFRPRLLLFLPSFLLLLLLLPPPSSPLFQNTRSWQTWK